MAKLHISKCQKWVLHHWLWKWPYILITQAKNSQISWVNLKSIEKLMSCHFNQIILILSIFQLLQYWFSSSHSTFEIEYTGWPEKNGTDDTVNFSGLCSNQQLSLFTLLDRASFAHYNNTKIIKFGWELFYFMSNFLWTVFFRICPISRVPRHE